QYYKRSADLNNAASQCNLGFFYEHGIGTEKNELEAFRYYLLSASQNHAQGQENTAICYLKGFGVKKSVLNAIRYFKLAADNHNTYSKNRLEHFETLGLISCKKQICLECHTENEFFISTGYLNDKNNFLCLN